MDQSLTVLFPNTVFFRTAGEGRRGFNELCTFFVRWLVEISVIREISDVRMSGTVVNREELRAPIR